MKKLVLVALLAVFQIASAQEKGAVEKDLVAELRQAWNQFDYAKSRELLNLALGAIERYPSDQQIEIYKFAAFIAFQNNNRSLAKTYLMSLLDIDPAFTPDPVTTPPKILILFRQTKVEYLEEMQKKLETLQRQQATSPPSFAFFVPGLEQWRRGHKTKGALFSASAAAALGGLVYSYLDAREKRDAYTGADDSVKIPALYDSYNAAYKRQFIFAYALAAVWAASQIDLHLWSRSVKLQPAVLRSPGETSLLVRLSCRF